MRTERFLSCIQDLLISVTHPTSASQLKCILLSRTIKMVQYFMFQIYPPKKLNAVPIWLAGSKNLTRFPLTNMPITSFPTRVGADASSNHEISHSL